MGKRYCRLRSASDLEQQAARVPEMLASCCGFVLRVPGSGKPSKKGNAPSYLPGRLYLKVCVPTTQSARFGRFLRADSACSRNFPTSAVPVMARAFQKFIVFGWKRSRQSRRQFYITGRDAD